MSTEKQTDSKAQAATGKPKTKCTLPGCDKLTSAACGVCTAHTGPERRAAIKAFEMSRLTRVGTSSGTGNFSEIAAKKEEPAFPAETRNSSGNAISAGNTQDEPENLACAKCGDVVTYELDEAEEKAVEAGEPCPQCVSLAYIKSRNADKRLVAEICNMVNRCHVGAWHAAEELATNDLEALIGRLDAGPSGFPPGKGS